VNDSDRRTIFNGTPGDVFTNDTDRVLYQLFCMWENTCGHCAQYDHAIGPWWALGLHFGCNCEQVAIKPGAKAKPFVDFQQIISDLDEDQQNRVIGKANYQLFKKAVVTWEDVVTPSRVRDLREVVARKKLSIDTMADAGVNPRIAEQAHESVHTPEHELVERQRHELVGKLTKAGMSQEQMLDELSRRLASRVTIAAAPTWENAAGTIQGLPGVRPSTAAELAKLMRMAAPVGRKSTKPAPTAPASVAPPEPAAPSPATIPLPPEEPGFVPWAQRKEETIASLKATTQPLHSNPMVAEAQRIGATAGCKILVVDDKAQSIYIWGLKHDEAAASYHAGHDVILINARSKYWRQAELDAAYERRWFATNDRNQIINHELGHWAHRHKVGAERFEEMFKRRKSIPGATGERIEAEVSRYARTMTVEAIAEIHAGLKAGKTYSDKVMAYYKTFGGPIPSSPGAQTKPGRKPPHGQLLHSDMVPTEKAKPIRGEMAAARREGVGKNAKILMADGSEAPAHIKPSMVPPQWTDVKVSIDPKAEVLVTARDAKDRPKMVTSQSYDNRSAAIKFNRVSTMVEEHETITREIRAAQGNPATKEEADVARLMQVQGTRPGSNADTKAKVKAYGATTLEARHVVQSSDGVRLQFVGKEGIAHDHLVRDKQLAEMLLERKNAAGSPEAPIFRTTADKVREFTASLDGGKFTPKDFRTSAATRLADEIVRSDPRPSTDLKEHRQRLNIVAGQVSRLLGNRPAQALESYIHPSVFELWTP